MTTASPTPRTPFPGDLLRVPGIQVGHHTDSRRPTGCTVVLTPSGAVGGVDVRGAAPGTRETDLLAPHNTVGVVHGLLLSGGSAFGLNAAAGVVQWLEEHGVGVDVGVARVPIVPAAVIFDLMVGNPALRPDAAAGYAACAAATRTKKLVQGNVGAGAGATVGKVFGAGLAMRGGLGSASLTVHGTTLAALVVCNALGDVIDPRSGHIVAGARTTAKGLKLLNIADALAKGKTIQHILKATNTTIGVIATDASLTKAQAQRLAMSGHDGLARSINPVHTPSDGDTLFALGTGKAETPIDFSVLCALAAEVTARAVVNAVLHATALRLPPADTHAGVWLPAARDVVNRH